MWFRIIIFGIVGLIILGVFSLYFFPSLFSSSNDEIATNFYEGMLYTEIRDYDKANKYFEEIIKATDNADIKARAQGYIASNNFRRFDTDSQRKAVMQLKDVLRDPTLTDERRAYTLNRLYGLYYLGRDPLVGELIFSDDPYQSLLVDSGGDIRLAIRKLAELSDSLFPTTFAKLRIAFWYGGALIDNKELPLETKVAYGKKITALIKESDELLPEETRLNSDHGRKAIFWHFRALNLAALYVAGISTSTDDFEKAFNEVFKLDIPERGDVNKTVHELTAFTHFYYAGFLSEISDKSRANDIRFHAEKSVEIVSSSKEPSKVPFYILTTIERDKPLIERDHNYQWFIALSSASPKFAEYLSQNGW